MDNREERLGTAEVAPKARPASRPKPRPRAVVADARLEDERDHDERDVREDRELTDDDRLEMFQDSLQQSVLPDLPQLHGYHVCWLTTNNPRDSIQQRLRMGYQLIRLEDCPGWDQGVGLKTGDYAGVIGINEMVAAKLPLSLYNRFMKRVHHELPLGEETKLKDNTDTLKRQAQAMGSLVEEGDGTAEVIQRARPPRFDS